MFIRKNKYRDLEKLQSELEDVKCHLEETQNDMIRERDKAEELMFEKMELEENCREQGNIISCLKTVLLRLVSEGTDYEAIYHEVSSVFDPEGYRLHDMAKKMTGIDVCSFFPTEDNLGYFEEANGYVLLDWIVKAKFGDIDWEPLNPPYEIAGKVSYEGQEENISDFYKELYKETVLQMLS